MLGYRVSAPTVPPRRGFFFPPHTGIARRLDRLARCRLDHNTSTARPQHEHGETGATGARTGK